MGNSNGRECGSDTPSEVEDEVVGGVTQDDMADQEGTNGTGEFMRQSPPPSPRAFQSPLMFRPQMPAVPLQRPDELHSANPSWMQTSSEYEDTSSERQIPTMIAWCHGGKEVAVEGTWNNWKTREPLQRSGKDFIIMKVLPSGFYQYRFIVDGQCRHSPDMPCDLDESGHAYNTLDLQEYVPEDIESISGFEPPQSPESSYSNLELVQEDFSKEPPTVPPHLNLSLMDVPSPQMEIMPPFSRPQHVILNHLYMHRDRSRPSVVALGSTTRFLSKYVTVVLYKSIQRA